MTIKGTRTVPTEEISRRRQEELDIQTAVPRALLRYAMDQRKLTNDEKPMFWAPVSILLVR